MRRLTFDGVGAAEAARIAKEARDPSDQVPPDITPRPPEPPPRRPSTHTGTAKGLRRAALALDPTDVNRLLDLALAGGVVRGWATVIAPALRDLGSQYPTAGRYIAAEHLLSGAVSTKLGLVPRPSARPRILLACAPAEQHSLPLEALGAALAESGIASRMLGAQVPTNALRDASQNRPRRRPDLGTRTGNRRLRADRRSHRNPTEPGYRGRLRTRLGPHVPAGGGRAAELAGNAAARDFVTDAYAHYKFIGHCADAEPLFAAAGLSPLRDDGFIQLGDGQKAADFLAACRELRFWDRTSAA